MRNVVHALAVFVGIAVLSGTAVPAGAQDELVDDSWATAPEAAEPEEAPVEATGDPVGAEGAETPTASEGDENESEERAEEAVEENAGEAVEENAEDASASEEGAATPPPRRGPALTFANSFFSYTNEVTFNSFAPGGQLSYNPYWAMSFSITPRFYLTDATFLWLNQGLSIELTDSDWTATNHEPVLTDTTLDLRHNFLWEGFVIQPHARLVFPLSKTSQSARRIVQTGLGVSITRPFPELASFTVSGSLGYRRWWSAATAPQYAPGAAPDYRTLDGETYCEAGTRSTPLCTQAGSSTTARDVIVAGLVFTVMPISGLTVQLAGFYIGMYGHEVGEAHLSVGGRDVVLVDDSPTHWRHFTSLSFAVGYDVLPYLNLSLGVQNGAGAAPLWNPDGSVRSPFNPDTQVFLTATVGIDALVNQLVSSEEEDGLTPEERQRRRQGLAQRDSATMF